MPRITPLPRSKFPVGARILSRLQQRMLGEEADTLALTAHSPGLVWSSAWMDKFLISKRSVPGRLIELVSVKTALELGCTFCIDLGSYVAASHHDVSGEELRALSAHEDSACFTEAEKAAFSLAVAMSATPQTADDALFARLAEHFTERQVIELTATVAWENYRSRMNLALGLTAQGYSDPGVCAVPLASAADAAVREGAAA